MARQAKTKRRGRPAKKKTVRRGPRLSLFTLFTFLSLVLLLAVTVGTLAYVIFFRVALAEAGPVPLFEEPLPAGSEGVEGGAPGAADGVPRYAVIIDDMGYHPEIGRRLIALPQELSFSFLPHAPHTAELAAAARRRGRTVLLHLPLEPQDAGWDPGEGALYLAEIGRQEQIFNANLARVPEAAGVNNHMGSRYSEDRAAMTSLLKLVAAAGLFYVDSFTSAESKGFELARELEVPTARRQVFLDNELEVEAICGQLQVLQEFAREQGSAVGIAHPHPETLAALTSCLGREVEGVTLVGIERLVR